MARAFQIAVGFLTIFRGSGHPAADMTQVGASAWTFPLVGVVLGAILLASYYVLLFLFPPLVTAVLVVGIWVFLTGGLHLDGWTDCWDAMAASVTPEARQEILKDSRLGTFGALALMLLIGSKISILAVDKFPPIMLFLAPVIGRSLMVTVSYGATCPNEGMATGFVSSVDKKSVIITILLAIAISLIMAEVAGFVALGVAYMGSLWLKRLAESRLNTFNGDVIGAMCEFAETLVLLVGCAKLWPALG